MTPLDQANRLVLAVERQRGLTPAKLDEENQVAFGTLMFKFLPESSHLIVAILVSHDESWNKVSQTFTENYRKSIAARSDPKIGGMFDNGGGAWMFDETTGKTYLYKTFQLNSSSTSISNAIEAMARVVPAWTSRWSIAVADIVHGEQPPPSHHVTLENDPYAGQL